MSFLSDNTDFPYENVAPKLVGDLLICDDKSIGFDGVWKVTSVSQNFIIVRHLTYLNHLILPFNKLSIWHLKCY